MEGLHIDWVSNISIVFSLQTETSKPIEQPENKPTEPSSGQPPRSNNFVRNSI